MVTRSSGIKKSNFLASTTIPSTATFDYVYGGVNTKILASDFLTAIGTTGSIEQVGGSGDTPILDDQGTVKGIRNIAAADGLTASIDANNSLEIKSGVQQGSIGSTLFDDLTSSTPIAATINAGTGMQIVKASNVITISSTGGALPTNNRVSITQLSDFPSPSSGVITLDDNKCYIIDGQIDVGANRFVMGANNYIIGCGSQLDGITSSTTGTLFTSTGTSYRLDTLTIYCTNGTVFDYTGAGDTTLVVSNVLIRECDVVGSIDTFLFCVFTDTVVFSATTNGLIFDGTNTTLNVNNNSFLSYSGTAFDLNTNTPTFQFASIVTNTMTVASGQVGIAFSPTSGNLLPVDGRGIVEGNGFDGVGTYTTGSDIGDLYWAYSDNQGIASTLKDSLSYLENNTTETVISSSNTPVLVAGTWVNDNSSQFTVTAGGRITYLGLEDLHKPIDISFAALMASGGDKPVTAYLAINGVVKTPTGVQVTASSSKSGAGTVIWQYSMQTGDYLEMYVENNDNTTNIEIKSAVFRIN